MDMKFSLLGHITTDIKDFQHKKTLLFFPRAFCHFRCCGLSNETTFPERKKSVSQETTMMDLFEGKPVKERVEILKVCCAFAAFRARLISTRKLNVPWKICVDSRTH